MTHLYIEQNGITEEVTSSVISKLYELTSSDTLDETSDLKGRLHTPVCYRSQKEYLTTQYSDLHITSDNYNIEFEDPKMLLYLTSIGVAPNGSITEAEAELITMVANSANTEVTKFNELKYFTSITGSKGGYTGYSSGNIRFYGWTALEEVDISNFTSLGHNNTYGYEDVFLDCTSLRKVITSNKLANIGYYAFSGCTSLEELTDLSGVVNIYKYAFENCSSLAIELNLPSLLSLLEGAFIRSGITKVRLSNLSSLFTAYQGNKKVFGYCTNLTEADFTGSTITTIDGFAECTNLTSITIPSTVTSIEYGAFRNTKISSFDFSHITTLGRECFLNTLLTSADLSNVTKIDKGAFNGCTQLSSITFPSTSFSWVTENNSNEGNLFKECTSLTSVDLSNCSTFSYGWFQGCTNLTSVTMPQSNNNVYSEMFMNCSNLDSLGRKIVPPYIGNNAFSGCIKICNDDVDLSQATYIGAHAFKNTLISGVLNLTECLTLGENPFEGCNGVTEIHAPKVTDLGKYTLWSDTNSSSNLEVIDLPVSSRINYVLGCSKLKTINAPLATIFGSYADGGCRFSGCPLLSTLNINFSAVTKLDNFCFNLDAGLNGQYLDFPNVTQLGLQALGNNGINFIFRNNSVITLSGNGLFTNYTGNIYVPDNLVDTYKATSGWSSIANLIKGISELPNN